MKHRAVSLQQLSFWCD